MRSCSRFQLLSIPAALEVSIPAFDTCKPWTLGLGGVGGGCMGVTCPQTSNLGAHMPRTLPSLLDFTNV